MFLAVFNAWMVDEMGLGMLQSGLFCLVSGQVLGVEGEGGIWRFDVFWCIVREVSSLGVYTRESTLQN
jgi:hypothetical protein